MEAAFLRWGESGYGVRRPARKLGWVLAFCATGAAAEPVTVVAFGDSLTAGYGLDTADGFVPQMQAWLDAAGAEVQLVNAGVSGDTSGSALARTEWTLTPDVDGMIVALGGNDYLRGLPPTMLEENLEGIIGKAEAREVEVMLVGLSVGSNYGPEYKAAFDAAYAGIATENALPLYRNWFAGVQDAAGAGGIAPFMQDDGIHPNAEGVRLVVEAMGPAVLDFVQTLRR